MSKLLSALILVASATLALNAQAASHVGGAPMAASAPQSSASDTTKKPTHPAVKKGAHKKSSAKAASAAK
jgi:hypothetical protein